MNAQEILREMHAEGIQRWPSIRVTLDGYIRYCARLLDDEMELVQLRTHAADLYLCCACIHQDAAALGIFEREGQEVVRSAITRVHRNDEFVRETQQEFWQRLLAGPTAKVNDYRGRGPLQAWLRIAAMRLAIDRHRAARLAEGRRSELEECLAEQAFGPESTLTRARFQQPFRDAFSHAIDALSEKDRNLLRMHVVGRCSIDQIGRAYHVHRATAARWLEQARDRIQQAVRAELELTGPRLTDSEFQSVARVLGGELEIELALYPTDVPLQQSTSTR